MNELINLGNGQFVKVTMLKGERGSNIATITKTGTSGLTDTYTITLTDGSTTTFEVTNGSSIDHIDKTSTVGSVDTYTIYLTDGTVGGTFEVNNAIATVEQNFSTTSENPLMNKTLTNIIAGVENGSTASKTYYKNDIILRNDSLYMVTTTVASGTAWADGVNIEEKTLGELIGEVKSALPDYSWTNIVNKVARTTQISIPAIAKEILVEVFDGSNGFLAQHIISNNIWNDAVQHNIYFGGVLTTANMQGGLILTNTGKIIGLAFYVNGVENTSVKISAYYR